MRFRKGGLSKIEATADCRFLRGVRKFYQQEIKAACSIARMGLYKLIERAVMVEWSGKILIMDVIAGRLWTGNLQSASHAVRSRTWLVTKGVEYFQGTILNELKLSPCIRSSCTKVLLTGSNSRRVCALLSE